MIQDYNKLFEKAREAYKNAVTGAEKRRLESIFPELAEKSEDEKVKNAIIHILNKNYTDVIVVEGVKIAEIVAWLEKQGKQKPAWSEEDEYHINTILNGLDLKRGIYKREGNKIEEDRYNIQYNWLKSLKNRVGCEVNCTTTKQWSEEDEKMLNQVKQSLYRYQDHLIGSPLADDVEMEINWLKSLKPHWKPTQEQMEDLKYAINMLDKCCEDTLQSLYNDLSRL